MSILNTIEEINIYEHEFSHLTIKTHKDARSFQVYMPKLMANFGFGDPTTSPDTINNRIFINDSACKPSASSRTTVQNFITVQRNISIGVDFVPRALPDMHLPKGTIFVTRVMEKNIRDMKIVDIE